MAPADYVWNDPDRPITVHIPLEVVSRLGLAAMEAYKAVPRRGLEIGGLLLGRRDGESIFIDSFEPVESEHRSGPSYLLSEADTELFEETLHKHPDAVGIYRTQTRLDSLSLQVDDVDLFGRYFNGSNGVYLLIQPSTSKAALFLPENDSLALAHEFSFRAGELAAESRDERESKEPATVPALPPVVGRAPRRSRLRWAVPIAAIGLGMACGALLYDLLHRSKTAPSAVAASPTQGHVALNVQRDGTSIRLLWDRNSPLVRNATKGIVYISDGGHQSQLNLEPQELNSGLVSYWPDTNDIRFRLEVFSSAGNSTDDSIRAVGGVVTPEVSAPRVASRIPNATLLHPTANPPAQASPLPPSPPPQPLVPPPSSQGSAARSDPQADLEEPSRPSPFTPAPKSPPTANPLPAAAAPASPSIPVVRDPQVWVKVEPLKESRGLLGRIPLLRRFKKQPQAFVPPQPVHEVKPTISTRERNALIGMVPVDVKVYVAESGKVQFVELLSDSGRHAELASSAIYAARRWQFSPARMGREKVSGEVILHFRFAPDETPEAMR